MKESSGEPALASAEARERIRSLAENEATRHFGDALPTPWQPSGPPAVLARWALRGCGCVIIAVLAAGGWVLAQSHAPWPSPASRSSAPLEPAAEPVSPARYGLDVSDQPVAAPVPTPAPTGTGTATATALRVERTRGVWRIRAELASRYEAARELAALSGTEVPSGANALRAARPLNLRWEGRDLAATWQAVIGNEASYALQCRPGRCTVWIVDPNPAAANSAAAAPRAAALSKFAVAPPAPAEPGPAERSAYD